MSNKISKPNYSELLQQALNEPGKISTAYRAMHNYSVLNRAIAISQLTDRGLEVSPLGSYGVWKKKGFQVQKGQKAISLWMPINIKEKDSKSDEGKMIFIMRPNWFAMSQTDGWNNGKADLPEVPEWDVERCFDILDINLGKFYSTSGCSMGYSEIESNTIAVSPLSPHPLKTLFHEMAHQLLHREGDGKEFSAAIKEVEAESVAFIVASTLDVLDEEASLSSRAYIQSWLSSVDGWMGLVPPVHAKRIFTTANRIIKSGELSEASE